MIIDLRVESVVKSVNKLDNLVRTEYNSSGNFLKYYAGKDSISNVNNVKNQVIYGRRGTGKTHILRALQETLIMEFEEKKILPIYIDVRSHKPILKNNNALYYSLIVMKGLIIEILKCINENLSLINKINEFDENGKLAIRINQNRINEYLNDLNYIFDGTTMTKVGDIDFDVNEIYSVAGTLNIKMSPEISSQIQRQKEIASKDAKVKYISFSRLVETTNSLINELGLERVVILIDEWSEIPLDYQPILSELLKLAFISSNVALKIAAIPNRTKLYSSSNSAKLGLEDGGDIFGYSLDNKYIYELEQETTRSFFNELLYNHLSTIDEKLYITYLDRESGKPYKEFLNQFFANQALREILIASAGIPRDFLHIFIHSYNKFIKRTKYKHITLTDIRNGTIEFYDMDKKQAVSNNPSAKLMLEAISKEIISEKKRCHFLIPEKYESHETLQDLIDLRVIHLRKKGISHKSIRDTTYNVYYIDYACYTSLNINHNKLKNDLLNEIETTDNFRDIRRIALDDKFFDEFDVRNGNCIKCNHCNSLVNVNHPAYVKQHICNHCYERIID